MAGQGNRTLKTLPSLAAVRRDMSASCAAELGHDQLLIIQYFEEWMSAFLRVDICFSFCLLQISLLLHLLNLEKGMIEKKKDTDEKVVNRAVRSS